MKYIVSTQLIENYGSHAEEGSFKSGTNSWKMKGGSDYLVEDLSREADALAFVMAAFGSNDLYYKEYPVGVRPLEDWVDEQRVNLDDGWSKDYLLGQLKFVSPKTGNDFTTSKPEDTEELFAEWGIYV
jgi:hypothetical protein